MRTVVIGDIHASARNLIDIVQRLSLTDGKLRWTAEDTLLVLTGDLCDRGYESKTLYELVMTWQEKAPYSGSELRFVIGNHEVMAAWGLSHYTTREEYSGYGDGDTRKGEAERSKAFSPGGWIHSWLLKQHFIFQKNGIVFSHGDLPSSLADWSVEEIEEYTRQSFISGGTSGYPRYNLPDSLFSDTGSVLWCREAVYGDSKSYERRLGHFLEENGSELYICGHTPSRSGKMQPKFSGRYLCVDTAMVFKPFGFGLNSALVIEDGRAEARYFTSGKTIQETLAVRLPG